MKNWTVHKFGGTSVRDASRFRNVAEIILQDKSVNAKAIVVSAMKGVTDDLLKCVQLAAQQNPTQHELLKAIHDRHDREARALIQSPTLLEKLLHVFKTDFQHLSEILRGIWLVQSANEQVSDLVSGMGEVWSAQILNAHFQDLGHATDWIDARKIVVVNHMDQRVVVHWPKSEEKMEAWLAQNQSSTQLKLVTVTGYVASTAAGVITTLGRNGSDYSGSIFGSLMNADEVVIWTDVDGVLSADPRLVPEAIVLDEMTYSEVTELAYFGAKVVHPATMAPAIAKGIPIWIKNSFNPKARGTRISKDATSDRAVKGFTTIDKMSLLNLEGTGMVGVPGVAERLFGALRSSNVNVVLISQASSENSICIAIHQSQTTAAVEAIHKAFYAELQLGLVHSVQVTHDVSIIAAVGDQMARSPGISGKFFTTLGRSGVNVIAIAQGSSERNISAVISTADEVKALRCVHSDFILPHQRFSIGVIGLGLIGNTFLKQLQERSQNLKQSRKVEFNIRAIANSKRMLLKETEIDLVNWKSELEKNGEPLDLKKLAKHLTPSHIPHAVIVEATASKELVPHYVDWLNAGLHIISPNKQANTGTMKSYRALREASAHSHRHFLYATNVGAGLPIVHTLRDLHSTGDQILMIQGILSGTLSYIFNTYDGTLPFSEVVKKAKAQGFTEPDPREDLSGQDVMRKVVILAREAGIELEPSDVKVTSLVPESLQNIWVDEFVNRLSEMDEPMRLKMEAAKSKKEILRFVGTLSQNGEARVGLETLSATHAFANVSGTDNIVLFKTTRYFNQPLVVQGPGAGPEVTAAGVFADLLRLSHYLGAPLQSSHDGNHSSNRLDGSNASRVSGAKN